MKGKGIIVLPGEIQDCESSHMNSLSHSFPTKIIVGVFMKFYVWILNFISRGAYMGKLVRKKKKRRKLHHQIS